MRKPFRVISALLVVAFAGATLAAAPGNEAPKRMYWMLQISIPDRPDFSVAARKTGNEEKPFGVIPLKGAGIPALGVVAEERQDDFVIRLYAAKDFKPGMKCQELRAMMTEPVATLNALKGEMITTESFAPYGVPTIGLLAYQRQVPVGYERPLCCYCGKLACCPAPGHCLTCADCGTCCVI